MSDQVQKLCEIKFRKHSGISARDIAIAEALVTEKLENYFAIEEILEIESPLFSFDYVRCDEVKSLAEVEKKAEELRNYWQLGNEQIISLTGILENKGIKVIEADLPNRFDGIACEVKRSPDKPNTEVIVVSTQTNVERTRFNLAHELAHRIIKRTCDESEIKLEKAMNYFAAAFLVPANRLRKEVGSERHALTYHELMELKHFYGISAAAMLMRLKDVDIVNQAYVDYAFRTYARSWRTEEPEPLTDAMGFAYFEKPMRFEQLVYRALGEQLISPVRASQLLKKPLSDIELAIKGPKNK